MKFEDLSPELQQKAKACQSPEDVLAMAKEEGVELSDEDLSGISGGWGSSDDQSEPERTTERFCPYCGSNQVTARSYGDYKFVCGICKRGWQVDTERRIG